jgi:hypothetical protein
MCPVGRYGSTFGLSTSWCSGYCTAGYYCPEGSTSATQVECGGPDVFCPPGSAIPQNVDIGYYTRQLIILLSRFLIGFVRLVDFFTIVIFSWGTQQ